MRNLPTCFNIFWCLPGTYSQLPKPSRALDQLMASKGRPTGLQIICTAYQIYKQCFQIFPNNEHDWTCNNHYNSVHKFYKPSLDIFRGQLWPTQVNFRTTPKMGPLAATHKHSRNPGQKYQKIILSFAKQHRRSRSISLVVPRFEPQINRS